MTIEHFNLNKKLHTDVLEQKYGPIHADVVKHDSEVREVNMLDKDNVSRTYALTFFVFDKNNTEVVEIDEKIKNGGLIGKTFREYGYEVRKNVIAVFVTDLPEDLREKMQTKESEAKIRLSEFYAKKADTEPLIYGIVSEIYSPDFRPAEVNEVDQKQDNPTTESMEAVGITKTQIWECLGEGKNFDDLRVELEEAKKVDSEIEKKLITKVKAYISHENVS